MHDTIEGRMDEPETKRGAGKAFHFNPKIGYPDKWKDYTHQIGATFIGQRLAAVMDVDDDRSLIGKPLNADSGA